MRASICAGAMVAWRSSRTRRTQGRTASSLSTSSRARPGGACTTMGPRSASRGRRSGPWSRAGCSQNGQRAGRRNRCAWGPTAALRQASGDGETLDQANAELHRLTTPVSLDKTVGDDGDATLGDLMANGDGTPEDHVMTLVDSDLLDELLGTLDARARYAVEARFGLLDGERKSFREVGESLGVTAEAARRLVSRAVAGLRDDAERILAV